MDTQWRNALEHNNINTIINMVNSGYDVDTLYDGENTALYYAAINNNVKMVRTLLELGANPDAEMGDMSTMFLEYLMSDDINERILLILLDYVDVNNKDTDDGMTYFTYACINSPLWAIKAMYNDNVDINTTDNEGWTPLMRAVDNNRDDVVKFLLTHCADTSIKNINRNKAHDLATDDNIKHMLDTLVYKWIRNGKTQ